MTAAEKQSYELYPIEGKESNFVFHLKEENREAFIAGHKTGAIAFAEWIRKNQYEQYPSGNWSAFLSSEWKTTEQLYEQFNQAK